MGVENLKRVIESVRQPSNVGFDKVRNVQPFQVLIAELDDPFALQLPGSFRLPPKSNPPQRVSGEQVVLLDSIAVIDECVRVEATVYLVEPSPIEHVLDHQVVSHVGGHCFVGSEFVVDALQVERQYDSVG